MTCPTCGNHLHTTLFHGVNIDRCPRCGGIWLGETQLTAIVARNVEQMGSQHSPAASTRRQQTVDYRSGRQTREDEEYLDDASYSHSYRLQELWGGPARHED